jgi:hypothetical protein
MAPLVHFTVVFDRLFAVALRRYDRCGAPLVQCRPQLVVVKRLVAEESAERQTLDQRCNTFAVVALARQQDEIDQVPQCVDQGDDLGGQATARAPNGLALGPPFAPVAF